LQSPPEGGWVLDGDRPVTGTLTSASSEANIRGTGGPPRTAAAKRDRDISSGDDDDADDADEDEEC